MFFHLRASFGLLLMFTLLTGVFYPLVSFGLGQLFFSRQANGSLIEQDGRIIGSSLIGQTFQSEIYFHGRPSAAGDGYDATQSSASNLAPSSLDLLRSVSARVEALRAPGSVQLVPVDLVTASASGLDPDISPAAARFQAARVADARHMALTDLQELVTQMTLPPDLGMLGESRVNVLDLNRALDRKSPIPAG